MVPVDSARRTDPSRRMTAPDPGSDQRVDLGLTDLGAVLPGQVQGVQGLPGPGPGVGHDAGEARLQVDDHLDHARPGPGRSLGRGRPGWRPRSADGPLRRSGRPVLLEFGPAEHPYEVGLTCGGTLSIFLEPVRASSLPGWRTVAERSRSGRAAARTVVVSGPDGHLGRETFADEDADTGALEQGVRATGRVEVFAQDWPAAPRMIIVGADGLAGARTDQARLLGYAVTWC